MTVKPTPPTPIAEAPAKSTLPEEPEFHVMLDGQSLGCYPTAEDAEAFANGHPRANGQTVEVIEVLI